MKSNITKMITMCMCMMVVCFAAEGKKHLDELQIQNPATIIQQEKAAEYSNVKKALTCCFLNVTVLILLTY